MNTENLHGRVVPELSETPLAIMPQKLAVIRHAVDLARHGVTPSYSEVAAQMGVSFHNSRQNTQANHIAVIPVFGVVSQRRNILMDFFGGTSCEEVVRQVQRASNDPNIKAIVLDIDSPGGVVSGVPELSKVIFEARAKKHIVAQVNSLMASAAYWIGTAADEVVITPSGETGSIGVYSIHQDFSEFEKKLGVKTSLISAGQFKTEGSPFAPLSESARKNIQKDVDAFYDLFISDIARNRNVSRAEVRNGFGRGRILNAQAAKKAGMVDRIASFDETLARLVSGRSLGRARALNSNQIDFRIARAKFELLTM